MKIKFRRLEMPDMRYTTLGYWAWSLPKNRGTLTIDWTKMSDWRFELAVLGHECIEALYCKLTGKWTEECDEWDDFYEEGYRKGTISKEKEPGHDPKCLYHWGHMAGVVWEYVCIYATFASWKKYEAEANRLMRV